MTEITADTLIETVEALAKERNEVIVSKHAPFCAKINRVHIDGIEGTIYLVPEDVARKVGVVDTGYRPRFRIFESAFKMPDLEIKA